MTKAFYREAIDKDIHRETNAFQISRLRVTDSCCCRFCLFVCLLVCLGVIFRLFFVCFVCWRGPGREGVLFVYFQSLPHHMDSYKPPIEEFSLFIEGGCCYARSQPVMAEESLHVTMQRTASPGVLVGVSALRHS